MARNYEELVLLNLSKIYHAKNQQLHRDELVNWSDGDESDKDKLIAYMEREHYIETEDHPSIYFLTSLAYEIVEERGLHETAEYRNFSRNYIEETFNSEDEQFLNDAVKVERNGRGLSYYALRLLVVGIFAGIVYFARSLPFGNSENGSTNRENESNAMKQYEKQLDSLELDNGR